MVSCSVLFRRLCEDANIGGLEEIGSELFQTSPRSRSALAAIMSERYYGVQEDGGGGTERSRHQQAGGAARLQRLSCETKGLKRNKRAFKPGLELSVAEGLKRGTPIS